MVAEPVPEAGLPRPDPHTVGIYESQATRWRASRTAEHREMARSIAAARVGDGLVADLGCGPGLHLPDLSVDGTPVVALDVARAMLDLIEPGLDALAVRSDIALLPFAARSLGAVWASKSYVHVDRRHLPLALWDLHRACRVGAPAALRVFCGDQPDGPHPGDEFGTRNYTWWDEDLLTDIYEGAGFTVTDRRVVGDHAVLDVFHTLRREHTLADTVGPDMDVLLVGLNPSLPAAEAGYGFAGPSNRFWRAARASGLLTTQRDPLRALIDDGVGMTDLVKRATTRASEVNRAEFRRGADRLERLVGFLHPRMVCLVGLSGWRAARDPGARPGLQEHTLAGRPLYVMPNPSGLNTHITLEGLTGHLAEVKRLASRI